MMCVCVGCRCRRIISLGVSLCAGLDNVPVSTSLENNHLQTASVILLIYESFMLVIRVRVRSGIARLMWSAHPKTHPLSVIIRNELVWRITSTPAKLVQPTSVLPSTVLTPFLQMSKHDNTSSLYIFSLLPSPLLPTPPLTSTTLTHILRFYLTSSPDFLPPLWGPPLLRGFLFFCIHFFLLPTPLIPVAGNH